MLYYFDYIRFWFFQNMTTFVFKYILYPFYTPRYIGSENIQYIDYPIIIAANHESTMDPICVQYTFREKINKNIFTRCVIRHSFFKIPIVSTYVKGMKTIPVKSGKGLNQLDIGLNYLKKEKGFVGIFPEGAINPENKKVKLGVAYLAYHSGCPVVPLHIKYHKRKYGIGYWIRIHLGIPFYPIQKHHTEHDFYNITKTIIDKIYSLPNKAPKPSL